MSTLVERIGAVFARKKISAKQQYYAALKTADAEAIAQAAQAAGIMPEEVTAHASILEKAAELAATAANVPAAEKALVDAKKRSEAAEKKLRQIIEPLEKEANEAAAALQQADQVATNLRPAVDSLHVLYVNYSDILPVANAPATVKAIIERNAKIEAETNTHVARMARVHKAATTVGETRGLISRIISTRWPYDLPSSPIVDIKHMEQHRDEYLAQAETQLAAAEKELDAAREAAKTPAP